mgnify:CR=1 FL=1
MSGHSKFNNIKHTKEKIYKWIVKNKRFVSAKEKNNYKQKPKGGPKVRLKKSNRKDV